MNYVPADHAPPMWEHQRRHLEASAHLREYALWWEPRTGKSRLIIDTMAYQYEAGRISAGTIGAFPSNVHVNWSENEIPAYLPRRIPRKIVTWRSGRFASRSFQDELLELMNFGGLAILTFNCEALRTDNLWNWLQGFMHRRRTMTVADESAWSATPSAKIAKRAEAWARRGVVRRIADGSPVDESPFDAFAQCNLLHRGILGFQHAGEFRSYYGDYEMAVDERTGERIVDAETGLPIRAQWRNRKTNTTYEVLRGYRNLDELQGKLLTFGSRVLRRDCADLPEKIYERVHFDLDATTRRAYDELATEYRTEIAGLEARATHQLARLGRLSMVCRGYWPEERMGTPCPACAGSGGPSAECDRCDGLGTVVEIVPRRLTSNRNEAIEAFKGKLEAIRGKVIVWAWHHWDVTDCVEAARQLRRNPVRYDGTVHPKERAENLRAFQTGKPDVFVATQDAAGRGIPLHMAGAMIYYNNAPSHRKRRQSEDRAEGVDPRFYSENRGTLVVDLVARDTIDEHWVDLLRRKRSIAEDVMGDPSTPWL